MKKIWHENGSIQYQQLTAEYLQDALDFIDTAFYPYENICQVLGLAKDPEAVEELRILTATTAKDGVTVIAIDTTTNKVVGAAFNKIQVRDDPVFENFAKTWKVSNARAVVEFMSKFDNLCNLFDHCDIDCLFELMFLGTSPEYKGRGIGKKLSEISVQIATSLANGVNVRVPVDDVELQLGPKPKVISSIFSSFITQRIGNQLGFVIAAEKSVEELDFRGVDFSSIAKQGTKKITLEYKRLL